MESDAIDFFVHIYTAFIKLRQPYRGGQLISCLEVYLHYTYLQRQSSYNLLTHTIALYFDPVNVLNFNYDS